MAKIKVKLVDQISRKTVGIYFSENGDVGIESKNSITIMFMNLSALSQSYAVPRMLQKALQRGPAPGNGQPVLDVLVV